MAINLDELLDSLTGIEATDVYMIEKEISNTTRRLALLEKLKSMAPTQNAMPALPGPETTLKKAKKQYKHHVADAARPSKKKLGTKLNGGADPEDPILFPGNLLTPDERRSAIAKLVSSRGPMTAGGLAESMKCDVAKVYNVLYLEPGKSLFERTGNGVELTDKGRRELLGK